MCYRTYREDVLDAYFFDSLEQLRILFDKWMYDYNNNHLHRSLNRMTPNQKRLILESEHKGEKEI